MLVLARNITDTLAWIKQQKPTRKMGESNIFEDQVNCIVYYIYRFFHDTTLGKGDANVVYLYLFNQVVFLNQTSFSHDVSIQRLMVIFRNEVPP